MRSSTTNVALAGTRGRIRRWVLPAVAAAALAAASPAASQEAGSRAEAVAAEQAKKAAALGVEGPTRFEWLVVKATSARRVVYPWLGSVHPGSGFAAGLGATLSQDRASARRRPR